jgi:uncharacterized lipoprotein YajG
MKNILSKRLTSLAMVLIMISLMFAGCSKTDKASETEPTKAA